MTHRAFLSPFRAIFSILLLNLCANLNLCSMKKVQFKLPCFIAILFCVALLDSCVGSNSGARSSYSYSFDEDYSSEENYNSNEGATLKRAAIIAQGIIESKFNSSCDFDDMDIRGEETNFPDRFKVYQRFSAGGQDYVYKIFIQYKGGDWSDKNNWSYGTLTIENRATGEQKIFNGTMKSEEEAEAVAPASITAGGMEFDVAEKSPSAIRISKDRKLSHSEMKAVVSDLKGQYSTIQFCVNPKTERGDEYAAYTGEMMFDYDTNEIKKFDDF